MSRRNFTNHFPIALYRMRASAHRRSVRAIALTALVVLCLVDEATATAAYIAMLSLGGLLLLGAPAAKRASDQSSECLVNVTRMHPQPPRRRGS